MSLDDFDPFEKRDMRLVFVDLVSIEPFDDLVLFKKFIVVSVRVVWRKGNAN
jgi:hypothetical protein